MSFDVTALPDNMRSKIMVSVDQKLTNGSVCWEWTGAVMSRGYGSVTNGKGKSMLAHRRAYMEVIGPIPRGLTIDHLCFNKLCVNTDHLEPVTSRENTRRALARQTHCKHGHPLSGDNISFQKRKDGFTRRICKTCKRRWVREHMQRVRGEVRDAA